MPELWGFLKFPRHLHTGMGPVGARHALLPFSIQAGWVQVLWAQPLLRDAQLGKERSRGHSDLPQASLPGDPA